jgi:hypothetical protein
MFGSLAVSKPLGCNGFAVNMPNLRFAAGKRSDLRFAAGKRSLILSLGGKRYTGNITPNLPTFPSSPAGPNREIGQP